MAYTWGSTTIRPLWGSMKLGEIESPIVEIPLLPNPDALTAVSSVIQQRGRQRLRHRMRLRVDSYSDYESFVTDLNAGTQRTLTLGTAISGTYVIELLGAAEYIQDNLTEFDITFLEA